MTVVAADERADGLDRAIDRRREGGGERAAAADAASRRRRGWEGRQDARARNDRW
jgi:hypothetical protein